MRNEFGARSFPAVKKLVIFASRGLPEVTPPILRASGYEKACYTAFAVIIYAWASQISLYGLRADAIHDPLFLVSAPLGASGGSVMSLGVLPVILASFIAQFGLG